MIDTNGILFSIVNLAWEICWNTNSIHDMRSLLKDLLVMKEIPVDVEFDASSLLLCCNSIIES